MASIVSLIAAETGMFDSAVERVMRGASVRYKSYLIAKRNGGHRLISQPAREVKQLQRALVRVLLDGLEVHSAATAYRPGRSIADNARAHAGSGPILKLDFAEFFPSIRAADWRAYCERTGCLTEPEDIALTTALLFHRRKGRRELRLAVGAPSSPCLSNVLMNEFDAQVQAIVGREKITYTRYADDMTFSAPRMGYLNIVPGVVAQVLSELKSPRLTINAGKTVYATNKYKRFVTGLVLANDGRVTIGKERKRHLRAAVHHALHNKLGILELSQLSGYLAFVHAVEPEFLGKLRAVYGDALLDNLTRQLPRDLIATSTATRSR